MNVMETDRLYTAKVNIEKMRKEIEDLKLRVSELESKIKLNQVELFHSKAESCKLGGKND